MFEELQSDMAKISEESKSGMDEIRLLIADNQQSMAKNSEDTRGSIADIQQSMAKSSEESKESKAEIIEMRQIIESLSRESNSSSAITPLPPPKSVFGMKKPPLPASLMTDDGDDSQMGTEVVNRKPARIAVAEDSSDSGSGSDGEQSTFSEVNTAKEKEVNTGNSSDEDSNIRVISKSDKKARKSEKKEKKESKERRKSEKKSKLLSAPEPVGNKDDGIVDNATGPKKGDDGKKGDVLTGNLKFTKGFIPLYER